MHNPFTKHPRETVGETWWQHCKFTFSIGVRLYFTSIYFMIHGLFPFIELHKKYNLMDTSMWLNSKNKNRELKRGKK